MTHKQQIRAIKEAVYNSKLSMNERKLYKWITTQDRHKHLKIRGASYRYPHLYIKQ